MPAFGGDSMLSIANKVNIGFHPTALPRGRGRAALAWLILKRENGAATFFELRDGVDDHVAHAHGVDQRQRVPDLPYREFELVGGA